MKCAAKVYFDAQMQASEGKNKAFFFFFFNKSMWWALCWLNAVLNLLGVYLCVYVDAWGHGRGVCVFCWKWQCVSRSCWQSIHRQRQRKAPALLTHFAWCVCVRVHTATWFWPGCLHREWIVPLCARVCVCVFMLLWGICSTIVLVGVSRRGINVIKYCSLKVRHFFT